MADLRLKVSEEAYTEALTELGRKRETLAGYLRDLQGKRQAIERSYTGPQATEAINTIKKNEDQVQGAIERVRSQQEKIQEYLNSMSRADTDIKNDYKAAYDQANSVFN